MSEAIVEGAEVEITPKEIAQAKAEIEAAYIDADTFLLDVSPDGRREYLRFDGDEARIIEHEDLTPIQEACKAALNEPVNHKSEFRHLAELPYSVLRKWGQERHGITDPYWFLNREYEDLVMLAAHDRDLSQFKRIPGNYLRRGVKVRIDAPGVPQVAPTTLSTL